MFIQFNSSRKLLNFYSFASIVIFCIFFTLTSKAQNCTNSTFENVTCSLSSSAYCVGDIVCATMNATCCANAPTCDLQVMLLIREVGGTNEFSTAFSDPGQHCLTIPASGTYNVWACYFDPNGVNSFHEKLMTTITVTDCNPPPPCDISGTISGTTTMCENSTGTLSVSVTGATGLVTYMWSTGSTSSSTSISGPGTYSVSFMDENSCAGSASINVTEGSTCDPVCNASLIDPVIINPDCSGNGGSITITATGISTFYGFYLYDQGLNFNSSNAIASSSTNPGTFTVPGPGTYWIQATGLTPLGAICSVTQSFEIPVPDNCECEFEANIFGSPFACNGELVNASVTIAGGIGPFNYDWSNGSTISRAQLGPGLHTVTVTDSGAGIICEQILELEIFDISPTIESMVPECAADGMSYTVNVITALADDIVFMPNMGTLSGTAPNFTITNIPLSLTSMTVTAISNALSCEGETEEVMFDPCACTAPTLSGTNDSNCGPGDITLSVSTDPICTQYRWYNAATGGTYMAMPASFTTNLTTTTSYYVACYNSTQDCEGDRVQVTGTIHPIPTLQLVGTTCSADLLTYDIAFSSNATVTSNVGTVSGSMVMGISVNDDATLTATNTQGCTINLSVMAKDCSCDEVPAPTNPNAPIICEGDAISALTVSVAAGYQVNWYADATGGTALATNTTSYTPTAGSLSFGANTFYAEAIDPVSMCTSSTRTPVIIIYNALPTGVTATATDATCGLNNGCITFSFSDLDGLSAFDFSIDGGNTWPYDNVPDANSPFVTPCNLSPGTYDVWVRRGNTYCPIDINDVTISATPIPAVAPSSMDVCAGETLNLFSNPSSGTTPYVMYAWTKTNGGFTSTIQNPVRNNATVGMSGMYNVTVYDTNMCSAVGSVNVTVRPNPAVNSITTIDENCNMSNGSLIINYTPSNSNSIQFVINNGSPVSDPDNDGTLVVNNLSAGTYSVIAEWSDSPSCNTPFSNDVIIYNQDNLLATVQGEVMICEGEAWSVSANGSSGASPYSYEWSGPNGFTATTQNINISAANTPPASMNAYTYSVTVTDVIGCTAVKTINLMVSTCVCPVDPPIVSGKKICLDSGTSGTIDITATSSDPNCNEIRWYDSASNGTLLFASPSSSTYNATVSATTTYYIVCYTDNDDCESDPREPVTITVIEPPVVTSVDHTDALCGLTTGTITICFEDNASRTGIAFSIDGGSTYPYSSSDNAGCYTIMNVTPGTYDLFVRWGNAECPVDIPDVTILQPSEPIVQPSNNGPYCVGETINLEAEPGGGATPYQSFEWEGPNGFTATTESAVITDGQLVNDGEYSVTVTDANGCTAEGQVSVSVSACVCPVASPSAPNVATCGPGIVNIEATSTDPNCNEIRWYSTATGGTALQPGEASPSTYSPNITATTSYYVACYNNTNMCESEPREEVVATLWDLPTVTSVNHIDPNCGETTGSITICFENSDQRSGIEFSTDGGNTYPHSAGDNAGCLTINSLSPATYDLWVRWGNDDCPIDIEDVVIDPKLVPTSPITTGDFICLAATQTGDVTLSAESNDANCDEIRWYNDAGGTSQISGPSNSSPSSYTANVSTTTTYYVACYYSTDMCLSPLVPVTATVYEEPVGVMVSSADSECDADNGSITFTFNDYTNMTAMDFSVDPQGTGPSWSHQSILDNSGSYTVNNLIPGTYDVRVRRGNDFCEIDLGQVVIGEESCQCMVGNPVVTGKEICAPGEVVITATSSDPLCDEIRWYANATGGSVLPSTNGTYTANVTATTSYYVVCYDATADCEPTPRTEVVVTLLASPVVTSTSNTDASCGASDGTIEVCFDDNPNRGNISFSIDGGVSYPYSSSDAAGCFTIPELSVGTYDLWVQWGDTDCPTDIGDETISEAGGPTVTTTWTGVTCEGGDVSIDATVSGGAPPYSYSWTGPSGFVASTEDITLTNVSLADIGSYVLVVTDGSNCQGSATRSVNVWDHPSITIESHVDALCGGTGSITVSWPMHPTRGAIEFGISTNGLEPSSYPYTGNPATSSGTFTIPNLNQGTYTIWARWGDNSCPIEVGSEIIEQVDGPMVMLPDNISVCFPTTETISAMVMGGTSPYTYSWAGVSAPSNNVSSFTLSQEADSGTYSVTVTDDNGCTYEDNMQVAINDCTCDATTPTTNNVNRCGPGVVILSAEGDGNCDQIRWYSDAAKSDLLQSDNGNMSDFTTPSLIATTTYYVLCYNEAEACESNVFPVDAQITSEPLGITVDATDATCGIDNGTIKFTYIDNEGMTNIILSFVDTSNPSNLGTSGAIPDLDGGTYLFNNLPIGTYSVDVIRGNGLCPIDLGEVTILNADGPEVNPSNNGAVCEGGTITLESEPNVGTPPYSFIWSGPNDFSATTETVDLSNAPVEYQSEYFVTVTDDNGCTAVGSTIVTVHDFPFLTDVASNDGACGQNNGSIVVMWPNSHPYRSNIELSVQGNVDANYFNFPIGQGSHTFTGLGAGTYDIWIRWGNDECPVDIEDEVITIGPSVSASITPIDPLCVTEDYTVSVSASGGTGFTYTWSHDNTLNGPTFDITNAPVGSVNYSVTVTNSDGCSAVATTSVTVDNCACPALAPSTSSVSRCGPGSVTFNATSGVCVTRLPFQQICSNIPDEVCGCNGITYINECHARNAGVRSFVSGICTGSESSGFCDEIRWYTSSTGAIPDDIGSSYTISNLTSSTTVYVACYNEAYDCESTRVQVDATINDEPTVSISHFGMVCPEENVSLTATPSGGTSNYTYNWTGPTTIVNPTANTINVTGADTGTYNVTVTDNNSCTGTNTYDLDPEICECPTSPPTTTGGSKCNNVKGSVSLTATGDQSCDEIRWYNSETSTSTIFEDTNNPSTYNATVSVSTTYYVACYNTANDCEEGRTPVTATVYSAPIVLPTNNAVCEGEEVTICATNSIVLDRSTTYSWTGPDGFTSNRNCYSGVLTAGVYTVAITNRFGCVGTGSTTVSYEPCECLAPIPTVGDDAICRTKGLLNTVSLTAEGATNCDKIRWYNNATKDMLLFEDMNNPSTYSPFVSSTTTYYAVCYDELADCEGDPAAVTATVFIPPIASITVGATPCIGEEVSVSTNISGGLSPYTTNWTGPNGFTSSLKDFTLTNVAFSDAGIYTLNIVDGNGCTAIRTINVMVDNCECEATPPVGIGAEICGVQSVTISASSQVGDEAFCSEIRWYADNMSTVSEWVGLDYMVTPSISTTYYAACYDSNSMCESGRTPVTVTVNDVPEITTNAYCQPGSTNYSINVLVENANSLMSSPNYLITGAAPNYIVNNIPGNNVTLTAVNTTTMCSSTELVEGIPCEVPCGLNPVTPIVSCRDNNTETDPSDDFIIFAINPTGLSLGSGYALSVTGTTISPSSANYGSSTLFMLPLGSAGSGDVTITLTDNSDSQCSIDFVVKDPETCSDLVCQTEIYEICDDASNSAELVADDGFSSYQWYNEAGELIGETNQILTVDANTPGMEDGSEQFYYTAGDENGCIGTSCCPITITSKTCCVADDCFGVSVSGRVLNNSVKQKNLPNKN